MRIRKVTIKNFRPYRYQSITFYKDIAKKDLFIIYGITGKGKSTFLDAIHWALYGQEFQSRGIVKDDNTVFNKERLMEMGEGEKDYVEVQIEIEDNNENISTIKRSAGFVKKDGNPQKLSEEVEYIDSDGVVYTDPATVSSLINGFVPTRVRQFFFMDGESLTSRFFSESSQALADEIREMAQLDIIDDAIHKLREIKKDMEREYASGNESLEKYTSEKIKIEDEIEIAKSRLENVREEIMRLKNEIEELRRQLSGIPNVEKLEERKNLLAKQIKDKESRLREKMQQKRELMLKYGPFILFDYPLEELVAFVESISENEDVPIVTDQTYLDISLKEGVCILCGHPLEEKEREKIKKDLRILQNAHDFVKHRSLLITNKDNIVEKRSEFIKSIRDLNKDISDLREDITSKEVELKDIERTLSQYSADDIRKKWGKLDFDESRLEELISERTRLEDRISELSSKYNEVLKKLEYIRIDVAHRSELQKQITFVENLLSLADRLRKEIKEDIRREIEKEAERLFKGIVWNPENFDRLEVDETFGVKVYHKGTNLEVTYELSGGQSKILALAFTIALHKVIKYNSPIIVDRPIVNISGEKLLYSMVKMFSTVAGEKQVILLLTPDELPDHLKKMLEEDASSVWTIENDTGNNARFVRKGR